MKLVFVFVVVAFAAFVRAEPPPSNSYLPPSPTNRDTGYPQGSSFQAAPQIVAARNLEQAGRAHGIGYSRSSSLDYAAQGRISGQGYDENAGAFGRNTVDDSSEPANYNFGYMVSDFSEGTNFGHQEERLEERAQGQYHVVLPDGRKQTVSYEADERGFKPKISYQDSEDFARSIGYDANANSRSHNIGFKNGGHNHGDEGRGY